MKGNKRIIVSISLGQLREDHNIRLRVPPSRYTFADVLVAIKPHWTRKRVLTVSNNSQTDKNAARRLNAHDYLSGAQALRKRLRCSFVDAEHIIQEQATCNEDTYCTELRER